MFSITVCFYGTNFHNVIDLCQNLNSLRLTEKAKFSVECSHLFFYIELLNLVIPRCGFAAQRLLVCKIFLCFVSVWMVVLAKA